MDGRLATLEANGTIYWHHTDHQGSVIATSNASGAPVSIVNYSPSGELGTGLNGTVLTAPPTGSPFGYTGRQYDPETGLWQYRARYYHPQLGQFLSQDPIGTKDDPNLYMYVANDPVNQTDPTGACPVCIPAFVGGLVGGGLEAYSQYRQYGEVKYYGRVAVQAGVGASSAVLGGGTAALVTKAISGGARAGAAAIVGNAVGGATGGALGGAVGAGVGDGLTARGDGADLAGIRDAAVSGAVDGAVVGAVTGGLVGAAGPVSRSGSFSQPATSPNTGLQVMPGRSSGVSGALAGEAVQAAPGVADKICTASAGGGAITVDYGC